MSTVKTDFERYRQKLKEVAGKNIKEIVNGEFTSVQGGRIVRVPVDAIKIPHIRYVNQDDNNSGVGRGEGDPGDIFGQENKDDKGQKGGQGKGEHGNYVELELEEIAKMLQNELHLPNIEPKGHKNLKGQYDKYNSIANTGPQSLRHKKRTLKEAIKKNRPNGVPFNEDFKYKSFNPCPRPMNNAVIFFLMDVSGCHTEGHYIEMADGSYKDVKDIVIGDNVCCVNIPIRQKTTSTVIQTFSYETQQTLSIATEDHFELRVTPKHKYFIYDELNNEIVEKMASELQIGDSLILTDLSFSSEMYIIDSEFAMLKIKSIDIIDELVTVYDFEVDKYNNYIINGILSHNSMDRKQLEYVRTVSFWIETWLRYQYDSVDIRYILHEFVAKEVDKETFYHLTGGGGTAISTAWQVMYDVVSKSYPSNDWNIYPFYFGDGWNWDEDTKVAIDVIKNKLLPISNQVSIGLIASDWGGVGDFGNDLLASLYGGQYENKLVVSNIKTKDDCYNAVKQFLGKGN